MKIVLTHSEGRFEGLNEALRRRGHAVAHRPLIVTRPRSGEGVRQEAEMLIALPWLLFSSRSAVEAFAALDLPWHRPDGSVPRVGAVGHRTASALRRAGVVPAVVAERSPNAAGLAEAFLADPHAAGPVGLPQGDRALPTLRRALEQAGFETRPLVLYETVAVPPAREAEPTEDAGPSLYDAGLVVLASPSAAQALPTEVATRAALIAIGPTTAGALEQRGLPCHQADTPNVAGVLAAVEAVAREAEPGEAAAEAGAEGRAVHAQAASGAAAATPGRGREDEGGRA